MPAGPGNKYPAEHRTQNRSHQSWHGDKVQNRQQFAARIGAQEGQPRHRHHHRPADPLNDAKNDQFR